MRDKIIQVLTDTSGKLWGLGQSGSMYRYLPAEYVDGDPTKPQNSAGFWVLDTSSEPELPDEE